MSEITLNATIRTEVGRGAAGKARREERVPGIFYLQNKKNIPIEVRALDLRSLVFTAETHIVNLKLSDGSSEKCVLKDVQFHPLTDRVIHFDLMGLVAGEKMRMEVPIALVGTPRGVRDGGVLQHILHKIEVECFPADLPEHIEINVESLVIGQAVTIGDISVPNIVIAADPELTIAIVQQPKSEEASASGEGEVKEPEVIAKGKATDEE